MVISGNEPKGRVTVVQKPFNAQFIRVYAHSKDAKNELINC